MKKRIITTGLILISLTIVVKAQWYKRVYKVDDINKLTREQLETSLRNSKTSLVLCGVVSALGGLWYIAARNGWESDADTTTFKHQVIDWVLGEEGRNNANKVISAGITAAGVIAGIGCIIRIARINSTLNKNYPLSGRIRISPEGIYNRSVGYICPGVKLTLSF